VWSLQTRLDMIVGATASNCDCRTLSHLVKAAHVRSLCVPAGFVSHCALVQTVWFMHSRSESGPGALVSHSEAAEHHVNFSQMRLKVAVGA